MTNERTIPSKKITVALILSWIFGIFFTLIGIIAVFSDPIPGIIMLVMAAVLLPPVNTLVDEKWKFHLSGGMKVVIVFIGFIILGSTVDTSKQQSNHEQLQKDQSVSNTKLQKNEGKQREEQPQTVDNEKLVETEIISTFDEKRDEISEEKSKPDEEETIPAEYISALKKATMYANTMHMSKQGIYDQLTSEYGEKFPAVAAQYAIDNMEADWNGNALVKAKTYQNTMNMSLVAIHEQLISEYGEKFTKAEADYAIEHIND